MSYEYEYSRHAESQLSPLGAFGIGLLGIAAYIYFAYALMLMARKAGVGKDWMAWVPIVNIYLMIKIAAKPGWWLVLLLIPFVNIIVYILVWMSLSERFGQNKWLGLLGVISPINLILFGYMAWKWDFVSGAINTPPSPTPPPVIPISPENPAPPTTL